ncbi:hypothetical protein L210DRAFT_3501021 [Boletus edulis BED1]|uniref:Uncharacterized protein n=1 Tax=Boletus edulis BED1 TaxID=1328754 RepID=A0AAD4GJ66_BOLED|nr:hypothetical protein L210DRAFT_3501021 [Boletus edulis BED1]
MQYKPRCRLGGCSCNRCAFRPMDASVSSDRVGLVTRTWVAYHVVDEQHASLASRMWEGNGFDHAEGYLGDVLDFLGHENAYMRMGSATVIVGAVVRRPQPGTWRRSTHYQDPYARIDQYVHVVLDMAVAQGLDRADSWLTRMKHNAESVVEHAIPSRQWLLAPSWSEFIRIPH